MGFSFITGQETIMHADNASFDGTERAGALSANGQLWIGSAGSPHVVKSTLTPGTGVSITNGPGSITIASSSTTPLSFPTDSGTATPALNILSLLGQNTTGSGIQTSASGSTVSHRMLSPYSLAGFSFTGGDLDVTRSASGANVISTISNTSNTASSQANEVITVAGATAGDPFTTYTVTGATSFSIGIDNSDSDKFVISASTSLGTSNVLTSSPGGTVTIPLANFQTIRSASAAPVTNSTINTESTNGASNAAEIIQTEGANGGDPWIAFTVNGVTGYSLGIDNSDSDRLKLTPSNSGPSFGTDIISLLPTGEINYPLQPAFFAWLSAGVADVTGDNTAYTIIYDTEVFDQNADFDLGTSIFTAPVTGKYQFDGQLSYTVDTSAPTSGSWTILTSNLTIRFCRLLGALDISQTTSRSGSVICDLDAADTAKLVFQLNGSTKAVDMVAASSGAPNNHFSGFLAC